MKIFIDADGCPVVEETLSVAKRHNLEVVILCDTSHEIAREGAVTIVVSKGADSVDYALVNRIGSGDIAVTQDYGLAAMCLAKGALPINQDGLIYTQDNIDALLFFRHTARELRQSGKHLKGAKKRNKRTQNAAFTKALEELIETKNPMESHL